MEKKGTQQKPKNSKKIIKNSKKRRKKEDDCSICLEKLDSQNFKIPLPCQHVFHYSCISEWFKTQTSCPQCRGQIVIQKLPSQQSSQTNRTNVSNLRPVSEVNGPFLFPPDLRGVTSMVVDQGKIISGSPYGIIDIWDFETRRLERAIRGYRGDLVESLAVYQGKIISSGNRIIKIWNLETGQLEKSLEDYHRDEVTSIVVYQEKIIVGFHDGTIEIWNHDTDQLERTLQDDHRGRIRDVTNLVVHPRENYL